MGVEIACVPSRTRLVDRKIHRDLVALGDLPRERTRQRHTLGGTQLGRQSHLKLARYPGVVALLGVFSGVPKPLAIAGPCGGAGIKLARQKYLAVQNIAAAAVLAVALRV